MARWSQGHLLHPQVQYLGEIVTVHPERPYKLEACVVSTLQAELAQSKGADRIELCIRLETEGMTPGLQFVEEVLQHVHIPVRVMVRETESGYEAGEGILEKMIHSIEQLKSFPIDGFVFGVLKNQRLNHEAMRLLLHHAAPFPVTMHKAIDLSTVLEDDIHWLNGCIQIDTILSSGGAVYAVDGVDTLLKMKSLFRGDVMGAGKITPENLPQVHQQVGLSWYHGRAIL